MYNGHPLALPENAPIRALSDDKLIEVPFCSLWVQSGRFWPGVSTVAYIVDVVDVVDT